MWGYPLRDALRALCADSRQVGGRFCLPLTLADDMQHGRGRSSERSGNPPLPPTHVQLPRLPIATVRLGSHECYYQRPCEAVGEALPH